jgi:hypothetical protein
VNAWGIVIIALGGAVLYWAAKRSSNLPSLGDVGLAIGAGLAAGELGKSLPVIGGTSPGTEPNEPSTEPSEPSTEPSTGGGGAGEIPDIVP